MVKVLFGMIFVVSFQLAQLKTLQNEHIQDRLLKSNQYKNGESEAVFIKKKKTSKHGFSSLYCFSKEVKHYQKALRMCLVQLLKDASAIKK